MRRDEFRKWIKNIEEDQEYLTEIERLPHFDEVREIGKMTLDELPEGYRESVWNEKDSEDEILETWYVGRKGAISYSGVCLTPRQFDIFITQQRRKWKR